MGRTGRLPGRRADAGRRRPARGDVLGGPDPAGADHPAGGHDHRPAGGGCPRRGQAAARRRDTARRRLAAVLLALGAIGAALTAGRRSRATSSRGRWWSGPPSPPRATRPCGAWSGWRRARCSARWPSARCSPTGSTRGRWPSPRGFLALGLGWVALTETGVVVPEWAGLAVGEVIALVGAQQAMVNGEHQTWAYGLTAVIAAACFAGYFARRSPSCWSAASSA
ncbi:hypothetical protein ACFQV2_18385 [Actinokineospora soli]|uniref:Uncharacterized protein n=1 Tax=Actinokineospora soli TaxID=1048753 RepID=A0ABW2TQV9_9PSEU